MHGGAATPRWCWPPSSSRREAQEPMRDTSKKRLSCMSVYLCCVVCLCVLCVFVCECAWRWIYGCVCVSVLCVNALCHMGSVCASILRTCRGCRMSGAEVSVAEETSAAVTRDRNVTRANWEKKTKSDAIGDVVCRVCVCVCSVCVCVCTVCTSQKTDTTPT